MATIPTANITHGAVTANYRYPYIRFVHPGTGLPVTMATADVLADTTDYGGKTLQEHINERSMGATAAESMIRTAYAKSGNRYLNTDDADYVVNGGQVKYDEDVVYSRLFAKASV